MQHLNVTLAAGEPMDRYPKPDMDNFSLQHFIGKPKMSLEANVNTMLCLDAMQNNTLSPNASLMTSKSIHESSPDSDFAQNQLMDYSDVNQHVKMRLLRFSSPAECGNKLCEDLNYRKHFHCLDCSSRVFIKKEEMIRHFKWHKKRDESLQNGFLRYSSTDNCSDKFPVCAHNRKQTHYHCMTEGCDKCYISTSDVQMHANYHRKASAIIQEGFHRYRAVEDCGLSVCPFAGRKTTHFHCRRPGCNFTFKNKAEMEKHKTYHVKDEQLNRDGFKKFMKHECCSFDSCRFSRVCNHIHCIRPDCSYVLHSSGQLYAHKRKHERRDNEFAYRKFKMAQNMIKTSGSSSPSVEAKDERGSPSHPQMSNPRSPIGEELPRTVSPPSVTSEFTAKTAYKEILKQTFSKYSAMLQASGNAPIISYGPSADQLSILKLSANLLKAQSESSWNKYLTRFSGNDNCKTGCELNYEEHYHCNDSNCSVTFRSQDGAGEHAKNHELQDQVTETHYSDGRRGGCCPVDCPYQNKQRHYHCRWQNCGEIILSGDEPFRRLNHYKMHKNCHKPLSITSCSAIDKMFHRKRGRPPKHHIGGSFKMAKLSHLPTVVSTTTTSPVENVTESSPRQQTQQTLMSVPTCSSTSPVLNSVVKASGTFYPFSTLPRRDPVEPDESGFAPNECGPVFQSHIQEITCERSTCKYQNRKHVHCTSCNQVFAKLSRLQSHFQKHLGTPTSLAETPKNAFSDVDVDTSDDSSHKSSTSSHYRSNDLIKATNQIHEVNVNNDTETDIVSRRRGEAQVSSPNRSTFDQSQSSSPTTTGSSPLCPRIFQKDDNKTAGDKKPRGHRIPLDFPRDEGIPEGYIRYRFNQDCGYVQCSYREHQTHFHCTRKDCGYRFCDKTRFVQHTARHERLDKLMGEHFEQFRAQTACGRTECVHVASRASHFHCLKCQFACTDTSRVVAHRRQHQKLEAIAAAGFLKFSALESCKSDSCSHNARQTHYHCVHCQFSVLGLAQMNSHSYRHLKS